MSEVHRTRVMDDATAQFTSPYHIDLFTLTRYSVIRLDQQAPRREAVIAIKQIIKVSIYC